MIVGSAIGIYYYLRIVFAMTKRPDDGPEAARRVPWEGLAIVVLLGLLIVLLGVYPSPVIDFVRQLGGP